MKEVDKNKKYIKLLKKQIGSLSKAILFYLTNDDNKYVETRNYVENILDKYSEIVTIKTPKKEEHLLLSGIPKNIKEEIVWAYNQATKLKQIREDLSEIEEMNEIF